MKTYKINKLPIFKFNLGLILKIKHKAMLSDFFTVKIIGIVKITKLNKITHKLGDWTEQEISDIIKIYYNYQNSQKESVYYRVLMLDSNCPTFSFNNTSVMHEDNIKPEK